MRRCRTTSYLPVMSPDCILTSIKSYAKKEIKQWNRCSFWWHGRLELPASAAEVTNTVYATDETFSPNEK